MPFLADWLTVFCLGVLVVVSPGPDFALTLRNSLAYSRRAGIFTAIGIFIGNSIHTAYSVVGIGAVIAKSVLLFTVLKWIGAAYLLYVGVRALGAKKQTAATVIQVSQQSISRWTALRIGLLGNLLNPKATLFWLALFTQIIRPGTPVPIQVLYGLTIATLALAWFMLVAIFISQRSIKRMLQAISHWLERFTGAVLIALGLRLAIATHNE